MIERLNASVNVIALVIVLTGAALALAQPTIGSNLISAGVALIGGVHLGMALGKAQNPQP
jgi:hypothetical protein